MLYKPAEIAALMGVTDKTVKRSYLPLGAPSVRDTTGHVMIPGPEFEAWAWDYYRTHNRKIHNQGKLKPGQAFCLSCRLVVDIQAVRETEDSRGVINVAGVCPGCGRLVKRFVKRKAAA